MTDFSRAHCVAQIDFFLSVHPRPKKWHILRNNYASLAIPMLLQFEEFYVVGTKKIMSVCV